MTRSDENSGGVHFIGVGGIGMSALAQIAAARGVRVSGSDLNADTTSNPGLARLLQFGASVHAGHDASNVPDDAELVVASAAIGPDNPEMQAAGELSIPVVSRAEYLAHLMHGHDGPKIAVSGTHGKTTTTAMIGVMLQEAGLDPTVFVGAEIDALGGNVRTGSSEGPFVVEACEAYGSFLTLKPDIAVVTNIEADHLDYYGDFDGVMAAFGRFVCAVPGAGSVVLCMDDFGVRRLEREFEISAEICQYGIEFGMDSAHGVRFGRGVTYWPQTSFEIEYRGEPLSIDLQVPGRHNVLNALATIAVGSILNLSGSNLTRGLGAFAGANRRQEILGEVVMEGGSILVIDDYAHHPTEIQATLEAVRSAYPNRRVTVAFQPHLYSRTRDFMQEFAAALSDASVLIVTSVYAAREKPIEGVRASDIVHLASKLNPSGASIFVPDKLNVAPTLAALSQPGDVALFLGAGDIRSSAEEYLSLLQRSAAA